ncbi:pilin [Patescibacteria group bacterium]|nr:pilin [Patescibacteria group bacterium]
MLKSKFIVTLLIIFSIIFLFNVSLSLAQDGTDNANVPGDQDNRGVVSLSNPLGAGTTPNTLIGNVINAVLGVIGSLALLMFVYGGITWMTSSGSPEKIKKGRDIIIWSVIGLAVVFFSYALVNFVIFDLIGG